MLNIEENYIELTRGDTARLNVYIEQYMLRKGDIIKFTVKRSAVDTDYLIQKIVEIEKDCANTEIKLEPEDTKDLEFGKYVYDVEHICKETGDVSTIIPKNTLRITEEVS